MNTSLRAHCIRLNPTPAQHNYFMRAAGVARFVYNWALTEYKAIKASGDKVEWNALKARFNTIKRYEFPFVIEVTKCASEQAIADLRQSISTYYKAKPHTKTLRFPGFRKRSKRIGGFGLANDKFSVEGYVARIPKLGICVHLSYCLYMTMIYVTAATFFARTGLAFPAAELI
jgi:putative transposase